MGILDYIERVKRENEGPRITAQEPRIELAGGQLVEPRQGFYEKGKVKQQPHEYLDQAKAYYGREFKDLPGGNKNLIRSGIVAERLAEGKKAKISEKESSRFKNLLKDRVQQSKKTGKFESYQTLYKFLKDKGFPITQSDIDEGYQKIGRAKSTINKALGNKVPGKENQYAGGLLNYLKKDPATIAKQERAFKAAVSKAIGKQPEIFEYLLKASPNIDVKDIAKEFDMTKTNVHDQLKKILMRVYVSREPGASTWLNKYNDNIRSTVVRNIRGLHSFRDDFEKRMTSLLQTAYKDRPRETYLKARRRYFDYSKAVREIASKFGKAAMYNLDHIIPLDFLYKSKDVRDPMDLIRVKPVMRDVNTFKSRFDKAFINIAKGLEKDPANQKFQSQRKAFNKLSEILPNEFKLGQISSIGEVQKYQAKPFSGTQSYLQAVKDAPKEQNILIDFLKKHQHNPEFKNALKAVGIDLKGYVNLAAKKKLPVKAIQNFLDKGIKSGALKKFAIPAILTTAALQGMTGEVQAAETGAVDKAKSWPIDHPWLTGAGTAGATIGSKFTKADPLKGLRQGAKKVGKKLLMGALGPTGAAGIWYGLGGVDLKSAADRMGLAAEATFAPELVKATIGATKGMKNRAAQKVVQQLLNLGMKVPTALRVARIASPLGLLSLGGEGLYHMYKKGHFDKERMIPSLMNKEAYAGAQREQFDKDQPMFASGGLANLTRTVAPDSGPMQGLASTPEYATYRKEYKWQT